MKTRRQGWEGAKLHRVKGRESGKHRIQAPRIRKEAGRMANLARVRPLSRPMWSQAGHQGLSSRKQVYIKWAGFPD